MGKSQRDKGARYGREVVNQLKSWGVVAHRVPLSGAVEGYDDDVVVEADAGDLRIECKRRKKLPAYFTNYLQDTGIVATRSDGGQTMWLLSNETMRRLVLAYVNREEL